ncbi:MAG TPA: PAS domain S-box protein, partial [Limnochordia bacterium]|nr:PAS domain S-box protein [Limnochordia bacterium]
MFRLLVESVEDYAIFMLDTEGHVVSWNPGAERTKGYTAEEIIGRHFSCFYPPEAIAEGLPRRLLNQAEQSGRATDEGWRVRKSGDRFWAGVTITALRSDDGELMGFAKVTRDLTERRAKEQAEAELLATEREAAANRRAAKRFAFLSRASHVFSSSLEFGVTLERVAEMAVPRLADCSAVLLKRGESELRWAALAHVDPAMREATRYCLERFAPKLSGEGELSGVIRSRRPLLLAAVTDAHLVAAAVDDEHLEALRAARLRSLMVVPLAIRETVLGALFFASSDSDRVFDADDLAFAADYAERAALAIDNARWYERTRAAEVAMRSRTQMLQAVIESSPLPIVVLDAKSVVIDYNRAGERAFGWRRDEVIGVNLAEAPAYVQALNERIEQAGWGEMRNGTITSLRRKDGSLMDVSVSAAVIRGADGGVAGVVAIFEDVTERTRFLRV